MRERAISAAILVPVLLVVLALGGAVLALAIAIITAIASLELFRLLRAAGHDSFPALGTVLALTVVLDAAFPDVLDGSGLLLSAIGIVLIAVAAFTRQDPRDGMDVSTEVLLAVARLARRTAGDRLLDGPADLAGPGRARRPAGSGSFRHQGAW